MSCRPWLVDHRGPVLIVTGDSPLTQPTSVRALLDEFLRVQPSCLIGSARTKDPAGLGRIVRDTQGEFLSIVEERDASATEREITEVNMSTYVFSAPELLAALDQLTTANAQAEYYVTDCPGIMKANGRDVRALCTLQECETLSINTMEDLQRVEAEMSRQRSTSGS